MKQHTTQVAQNATRAPIWKSGASTRLSISASAATGKLKARTVYRIMSTVDAYVAWGDTAAVVADSTYTLLPANTVEYVLTGDEDVSRYLSAVDTAATGGTLYVTECT